MGTRQNSGYKVARAVTLLAWLMLLGQTVAHAGDLSHANVPSHHCVVCSAGAFDDDINTSTATLALTAPTLTTTAALPQSTPFTPGIPAKSTSARAPPRS